MLIVPSIGPVPESPGEPDDESPEQPETAIVAPSETAHTRRDIAMGHPADSRSYHVRRALERLLGEREARAMGRRAS